MKSKAALLTNSRNDLDTVESADSSLLLSLDALVRSVKVKRASPIAVFLGAGSSTTSGVPSAQLCIWEWKRQIFLTKNPGLEDQFSELSLDGVRRRIQNWFDKQGSYPKENSPEEYGFYIQQCFPIEDDRRAYFQNLVRDAVPHTGYRLLCHLAEADLIRSVWSTNFDGLAARAAANFKLAAIEIGIDTRERANRKAKKGELFCVSMHGDYRYDKLKNTRDELQEQEAALRKALIEELKDTSIIVSGYSGRDQSLMDALGEAYSQPGSGILYWCGVTDEVPAHIKSLIEHARSHGRQAYFVPSMGFDDLITRLGFHCLDGERRLAALKAVEESEVINRSVRLPWKLPKHRASTLIKSNAFAIECPSEILSFDLKEWPAKGQVWPYLREKTKDRAIVAVPLKGKIFALGLVDEIKNVFDENIKGSIDRSPVVPKDLSYDDGAIISLFRQALTRSMAYKEGLASSGDHEIWETTKRSDQSKCPSGYIAYDSVLLYFRRIAGAQYLVLKPTIKILDTKGVEAKREIAAPIKLAILGYQHNKPFNEAVMKWRGLLLHGAPETIYEFPRDCGSTFRFKVRRSPVFGEIGLPSGGKNLDVPDNLRPLIKYTGVQLSEPELVFSNKAGTGAVHSPHPIRGLVDNRPFDFPLTQNGFFRGLRLAIVAPQAESAHLFRYLQTANKTLQPSQRERDYLVDYPGFQSAYGIPIEIPRPGENGWHVCAEPSSSDPQTSSLEIAGNINRAIDQLRSGYSPHVVLVFYPNRWSEYRGYKNEAERFDVRDFVKAFCVQRGIATQFFSEETMSDAYQARVWWWLSLALYVKAMRTPWVLNSLADDTAFVGLGFSIDHAAEKGKHVVLGCSHIYSGKGEGLQYRLSKVEEPVFYGKNPFMSKEDARRTGETIRQLFFDARMKLPERVVLHKRTRFTPEEREGLIEGLGGVKSIDMLEIQVDDALRFVASVAKDGGFVDDGYPVRRGTVMKLDDFTALLWVHGATSALDPRGYKYFQGKRRIPAPLTIRRHAGNTDLQRLAEEILGLSKMNWNTFDLYTKLPATVQSSNEIARIGSLLQRFGTASYDYRLFI